MRKLLLLLALPLILGAKPAPSGEVTLVSTSPVTFTAVLDNVRAKGNDPDKVWVSLSCFDDAGTRVYYGEEVAQDGLYVMDDTVWVNWTPGASPQPGNICRGFLLYVNPPKLTVEVVLDVIEPFVVR